MSLGGLIPKKNYKEEKKPRNGCSVRWPQSPLLLLLLRVVGV
jgi:hypothetical protein